MGFDISSLGKGLGLGVILLVTAILEMVIGAGLTTLMISDRVTAVLIGVSMVARAEIAMVIMQHGRYVGDWAVPP